MCVCVSPSKDSARLGRPQYGMLTQHQDREAPVARVRTERQEEGTLPAGERTDIYSYMEAGSQDAHVLMSCNLSLLLDRSEPDLKDDEDPCAARQIPITSPRRSLSQPSLESAEAQPSRMMFMLDTPEPLGKDVTRVDGSRLRDNFSIVPVGGVADDANAHPVMLLQVSHRL